MSRSFIRSTIVRAGLLLGAAGFSACSAGYSTDNNSNVLLIITVINGGTPLKSDVLTKGSVVSDSVAVDTAVRFKNINIPTTPSVPNAVLFERYEISYRRSDGRGVQGQDVPYTISGNMSAGADVTRGDNTTLNIEVVRAQAKLEPPLRNLQSVTGTSLGGALVVTMFADITIHGRTVSGQTVTASGSLQIDFADYADQ